MKKSKLDEMVDSLEAVKNYSGKVSDYVNKSKSTKVSPTENKIQTENQIVLACHKLLIKKSWIFRTLYTGGIPTGKGYAPNPAKGIPDCIAFDTKSDRMIWIEFKKSHGGLISQEQKDWHVLLRLHKCEVYIINSVKVLEEVLNESKRPD